MPARAQSAQITTAYRQRLLAIRQQAIEQTAAGFSQLNFDDLDASWEAIAPALVALLEQAKRTGVILTAQYLAAYVASELAARQLTTPPVQPDAYATVDQAGRPLAAALAPALWTVKARIGQGAPFTDALQLGRARMSRLVASEAMAAPRESLQDLMEADGRVVGWGRVTSANPCGACLAAADGELQRIGNRLRVHPECRCTAEPAVAGVPARILRPNGKQIFDAMTEAEQNQLFHGRGGVEKARLLREGVIEISDLLTPAPFATQPDGITETALAALAALAPQT